MQPLQNLKGHLKGLRTKKTEENLAGKGMPLKNRIYAFCSLFKNLRHIFIYKKISSKLEHD